MGIAFKPNIDDLRESPALVITAKLSELGYELVVVEPNIDELPVQLLTNKIKLKTLNDVALSDTVVSAVLVAHSPFKSWIRSNNSEMILDFCGLTEK